MTILVVEQKLVIFSLHRGAYFYCCRQNTLRKEMAANLPARVQIILNGRRYEAEPAVVVANFNFFAHFYAAVDAPAVGINACHTPHAFKFRREMSASCNDPAAETTVVTSCSDAMGYRTLLCALPTNSEAAPAAATSAKDFFDFGAVPSIAPDFFGPILVAARKGRLTPSPFVWNDYNFSEQEAIAFVVRIFGVAALISQGQHVVTAEAVPLTAPAPAPAPTSSSGADVFDDEECDDEGMPRLNVGCSRCGTQEHSDTTCRYRAGVPGVSAAAEPEVAELCPNVSDEAARLAAQTMGIAFGIPRAAMEAVARLGSQGAAAATH
jgi:hypothetical protein